MANEVFSLQGKIRLAKYDNSGVIGDYIELGSVTDFSFGIEESTVDVRESVTGNRSIMSVIPSQLDTTLTISALELNPVAVEAALRGVDSSISSSTYTNFTLPITFAEYTAGRRTVVLDKVGLTNVVVEDSTPATVTGVIVEDAKFGVIKLPEGLVTGQFPLTIDANSSASSSLGFLTGKAQTYSVRLEGINTAINGSSKDLLVEFYRVQFSPATQLQMIAGSAQAISLPMDAKVLLDPTKVASVEFGKYGRMQRI